MLKWPFGSKNKKKQKTSSKRSYNASLKTESAYFDSQLDNYLKLHRGKYVLIKGKNCYGFFNGELEAYNAGTEVFGIELFFIKEVVEEIETDTISTWKTNNNDNNPIT